MKRNLNRAIGNNKFKINGYLAAITISDPGDNSDSEFNLEYQVDTYWPQKQLIGAEDSVVIATYGNLSFTDTTRSITWTIENFDDEN